MASIKYRLNQFLLYLIIFLLLTGGIMGILKRTIQDFDSLSLNYLLGIQGDDPDLGIVTVYSITLGIIEILASGLLIWGLIIKRNFALYIGVSVLSISALGCVIAILFGDLFAIFSLAIRIIGIVVLLNSEKLFIHS